MKKLKRKLSIVLVLAFMFTMVLGAPALAASWTSVQKVDAYSGVKIFYNGQQLTSSSQPFIINDTTYVPLRLIMETLGNAIYWDAANYRVMMTGTSASELAAKDAEIATLKNKIAQLEKELAKKGGDLADIEDALSDFVGDAGSDYFGDSKIKASLTLSGDEDAIAYTIKLDFGSSKKYDDLSDLDKADIEDFLDDVKDEIIDETDGTDFEDAKITGKLVDYDSSKLNVKYDGRKYTYSWKSSGSDDLGDIEEAIIDYFEDAGDEYFDDEDLEFSISLKGDDEDIDCQIEIDFAYSNEYDDLSDLSKTKIRSFLSDVFDEIEDEIEDTFFEDADVVITLEDEDDSRLNVEYDGTSFDFSW